MLSKTGITSVQSRYSNFSNRKSTWLSSVEVYLLKQRDKFARLGVPLSICKKAGSFISQLPTDSSVNLAPNVSHHAPTASILDAEKRTLVAGNRFSGWKRSSMVASLPKSKGSFFSNDWSRSTMSFQRRQVNRTRSVDRLSKFRKIIIHSSGGRSDS
uniref:(northern house mosquito) hypothetical protein n=1 Tax=Culex pipiens TaxID=7175 RepID=A0A8D8ICV7_CULPI